MTAIRNVGELASPYFLLEVWARRAEIDIDPETYASLKRKARKLVRDARVLDDRGEEPDRDWLDRRLDLLGIEAFERREVMLGSGEPFELLVWSDADGNEALLVADLPGFSDPDRRSADEDDPPATRFELALDVYEGDADWGVVLAGTSVRVYRRSSGISQQYLELSLDSLVELDDEPSWKAFAAIFRTPAFSTVEGGVPLIRRVVDESRRHAAALAADMRSDVIDAAEAVIQGVLDDPTNAPIVGEPTKPKLQGLFEETLYYLYRILFVLFAESRDVLPVSGGGAYASTYSLDHVVELARGNGLAADGGYCHAAVKRLFSLLWHGPVDVTEALGFEPVGGELFDPGHTPTLDACRIRDEAWTRALKSLALGAPDSARGRLGRRSSFAELGVDQLGSIYEGLLVLEPYLAPGARYVVSVDGDRRVLEDKDGFRVVRELDAGDFVLESASGRRKGSGSFYTPDEITEYLTHAALDPLVEPIVDKAQSDPAAAARELLDLKVCDPAMGSGAFLVQTTRILALGLARIWAAELQVPVTPELRTKAERTVVRRCIYGVDLNPLAVALAKVSLWLETLEPGRPLDFLDGHLRCGDSLVGVTFTDETGLLTADDLATFPAGAVKGLATYLKKEAGAAGAPVLKRLKERKAPQKATQAKLPGIDAFAIREGLEQIAAERDTILAAAGQTLEDAVHAQEAFEALEHAETSLRNRLRSAADFWCAQWFSDGEHAVVDGPGPVVPASVADFEAIIAGVLAGEPIADKLQPQMEAAQRVANGRHFFHWALEFPEVMLDRGGFDAVIGNPPWNTLSPDVKEFFATYDPTVFRKGVAKATQTSRKDELREDEEIDQLWREQARYLHELSVYAKPESGRFEWYAADGQLRKGDANVFRLFVERAYRILRKGGRLAQVLPDSFYVSSPATGVRQYLLRDARLEQCFVFENRRGIFPIDSRIKIALMVVERGGGPTDRFKAVFFVGKDAAGRDRAVGLEEMPEVLAELDREAPELAVEQIRQLAPETWSFPELQTALDAEVVARCLEVAPALNLDSRGWNLSFCRGLHDNEDYWRFKTSEELEAFECVREGIRWIGPKGDEWWPVVAGLNFYSLEFPAQPIRAWVNAQEIRRTPKWLDDDGMMPFDYFRIAWRDVASATNERSSIAAVLPPKTVEKVQAPSVWGGTLREREVVALAAIISSFTFDFLARFRGSTHLSHGFLNSLPAPTADAVEPAIEPASRVICSSAELKQLWGVLFPGRQPPHLSEWGVAENRAEVDAEIALAYGLSLTQYAAVLCGFPNIDRIQPMLPGEPKSFVTRDLALLTYCEKVTIKPPDVAKLMREIGVDLPDPKDGYGRLDDRVKAYQDLGAVPYRPTPRGGKPPTDPALIADVLGVMSTDGLTAEGVAEALEENEKTIATVLKGLVKDGEVFREGKGKRARFYVLEGEE